MTGEWPFRTAAGTDRPHYESYGAACRAKTRRACHPYHPEIAHGWASYHFLERYNDGTVVCYTSAMNNSELPTHRAARERRLALGLGQGPVGELAGVDRSVVCRYENGSTVRKATERGILAALDTLEAERN